MRTFVLALMLLLETCAGSTSHARENQHPVFVAPPIQELGNSAAREDRIYAAEWLGEDTQLELRKVENTAVLEKLLSDEDMEVASRAAVAVQWAAKRAAFDAEAAMKFVSLLKTKLAKQRIEDAFTSRSTEEGSRLLVCRVMALNALYRNYPIISVADYAGWQEEVLRSLVIKMALHRPELSKTTDAYTEFLLQEMEVPGPLLEAARFVTESLDRVPLDQVAAVVGRLSVHPLFQDERPLSPLLIELLRPQKAILQKASSLESQQVEDPERRALPALLKRMDTSLQLAQ